MKPNRLTGTKAIMAALVRQPPKQHQEISPRAATKPAKKKPKKPGARPARRP